MATRAITTELALRAVAADPRGQFTTRQALDRGWSRQRLHRWHVMGRVERVHARVHRFVGAPTDWSSELLAAVLASGSGAVASHRSAMALHGIEPARRSAPTPIEVSVPAGRDATVSGVTLHRVLLPSKDVTCVDGIPCTTYERTLLDSSARLALGQLARGLDQGPVTNRATVGSTEALSHRLRLAPGRRLLPLRTLASSIP